MNKKCLKCGFERVADDGLPGESCPQCGAVYAKVAAAKTGSRPKVKTRTKNSKPAQKPSAPVLALVFYLLGVLGFVGGLIICVDMAQAGLKIPAFIWFSVGVIECALMSAIGLALTYLRGIYLNTSYR